MLIIIARITLLLQICPCLYISNLFLLLLRRCSGKGLHLAMTGEPRGFSRVTAGFSSYDGEYLGLISVRIDWFDLPAVQETLKSLLQHHNSKAPILWGSAFFMAQLSHPYMTTG